MFDAQPDDRVKAGQGLPEGLGLDADARPGCIAIAHNKGGDAHHRTVERPAELQHENWLSPVRRDHWRQRRLVVRWQRSLPLSRWRERSHR